MQVQNVNNYSQMNNPNFTSIKSVRCEGLYKKYPEFADALVTAFQENPKAMEFFKKYDVNIVFHAVKQMQDAVASSINIFFDNVAKSKPRKFFDKLTGNTDDKVVLHAWGNKYSLPQSLKESTVELIDKISPERKVGDSYRGGMLDSHLKLADEEMQKIISEKSKKNLDKYVQAQAAKASKARFEAKGSKLQNSIDELIKKGS